MTNLAQRSVAVGLCAQVVLCVPVISANAAVPLIRLVEGMVVTENVAYNQPPHTGFFLGTGMKKPPKPNIVPLK